MAVIENRNIVESAVARFSLKTQKNKIRSSRHLLEYLYNECGIKKLVNYTLSDFERLFLFIEKKKISKKMKVRYRSDLRDIIFYAIRDEIASGRYDLKTKYDYLFSDEFFTFSESSKPRIIIQLNASDITQFLAECRSKSIDDYIWFSILIYSGCRISGLCNLIISDIDFKTGKFQTQEKKTKHSSGLNTYFLPGFFLSELKVYLKRRCLSRRDKVCNISDKQLRIHLKRYRSKWWPHIFRHTIRTLWYLRGMSNIDAELLLNHRITNLDQIYLQQLNNIQHLREIYDKYFPY